MKGIRKVFLGLVLMTLFGVGFNVSVKAANTSPVIKVVTNKDLGLQWELTLYYDKDNGGDYHNCFPDNDGCSYTYTYEFIGENGTSDTHVLKLTTKSMGSDMAYFFTVDDGTEYTCGTNAKFPFQLTSLTKEEVKERLIGDEGAAVRSFKFDTRQINVESEGEGAGTPLGTDMMPCTVSSYKVNTTQISDNPKLKLNYSIKEGNLSNGYTYLLPEETITITAAAPDAIGHETEADGTSTAYRWGNEWKTSDDSFVRFDNVKSIETSKQSVDVTMSKTPKQGEVDIHPQIGTVKMSFDPSIDTEKVVLKPGDKLGTRTTSIIASEECRPYSYDNGDVESVKVNGIDVKDLNWTGSTFSFTVDPETPTKDNSSLIIKMIDGNTFHRSLKITAPEYTTVTVSPSSSSGGTVTVENVTTKEKGTTVKAENGNNITITAKAKEGYSFVDWTVTQGEADIEEESENTSFVMGDESVSILANFAKKSTITFKPIKVTKGKKVKMSDFVTPKTAKLTVTSLDESIVTVDPDGDPEEVSNIEVTGVEPTSTSGVEAIQIATSTAEKNVNVTVYNTPKLSVNKTAASSASGLAVTMPSAVYYNSTGSLTDYEPENFTVVYTHGNEEEKEEDISSISIKSFSKSMKELLDDDEGKVEVIVSPVNPKTEKTDNNVKSNKVEIKVYKIELDGSSGANYKVNEKDIDDGYFYAIEDVDYKITATNKSGYTSTIERWEGVDFGTNTGGTKSFDDTKTIKAVFKSSSTFIPSGSTMPPYASSSMSSRTTATGGSGSGTSGGDYDDVPKTGESKTDIWILWSVLLASILGAGFMIYKRFGLVRAIAEADRQEAEAVQQEMLRKKEKDKENMIDTIKGLRKL